MENRNFQLDKEWNMVHYPTQPTGFGILIIGDERSFVEKGHSYWTQNEGKLALINNLKETGYMIFYSNLYGKNWGAKRAVTLAKQLYEYIVRNEILNKKIHIIAEGMGALVAIQLCNEIRNNLRSVVLINPILSLKNKLNNEKEKKFFYKKLIREIAVAYELDWKEVEDHVNSMEEELTPAYDLPVKIIQILRRNDSYPESTKLSEMSAKWASERKPISICYMVPEKTQQLSKSIVEFFKSNENVL